MKEISDGIFLIEDRLATQNRIKDYDPFNDGLVEMTGKQYRFWNPTRSKLAAAIMNEIKFVPIKNQDKLLYLGVAHGMTASHISDIIGNQGIIYGVEFSDRPFQELLPLCEKYRNISPILADARKPETFYWVEKVDVVYVDIAQPDATEITIRNCREFLKKNGFLLFAIKARSVDVTKSPNEIYKEEIEKLKKANFEIIDWKKLEPFEDAHAFIVAQIK